MSKFLVHVTCGPENPSKAALALLVAKSAIDEGHEVKVFLAADAVQLLRSAVVENLTGLGTGALGDHLAAVQANGGKIFASGMSAKSRGLGPDDLGNLTVEFAMPTVLVQLADAADTVLCY